MPHMRENALKIKGPTGQHIYTQFCRYFLYINSLGEVNEIILKWGFEIFSIIMLIFQRLVVEIVQTVWLFWINPCVLLTSGRKIDWNTHLFFLQTIGYQCGRKILHSRAQWPKWMGGLVFGQAAHGLFEGWTCQLFTNYTLFRILHI